MTMGDSHVSDLRSSLLGFRGRIPREEISADSSIAENPVEKDESQNWQTREVAGKTAPHCEQIFVTESFALRTHPLR
jgi:hypothetical protein